MKDLMKRFWNDESGQGLTEYALIVGLISIALVILLTAFRRELGEIYNDIVDQLETVTPAQVPET